MPRAFSPSNATEYDIFAAQWCAHCIDCPNGSDVECNINLSAMAYRTDQQGYPGEWIWGDDGRPKCTAFHDKNSGEQRPYRCDETDDIFQQEEGA